MSNWVPVNENHAISIMAAFVEFANPLPDKVIKTCLSSLDPLARDAGLTHASRTSRLQIQFSEDGTPTQDTNLAGQMFTRRSDAPEEGAGLGRAIEQVSIDAGALIYRTWDYISWEWQEDRIVSLLDPLIKICSPVVSFQSIGLEYVDRFWFDGDPANADIGALLRSDSRLVAPHVFHAPNLFHSYTGAFVDGTESGRKLQAIRIDASDEDERRWVSIATRQELRITGDLPENPDAFAVFDEAHSDLKALLSEIITTEQAQRIYLEG
ncbi:hypothetical protein KZ810_03395 [Sphingomonas sp. RHCKR47]|uniref:hypothetical protein n=1 Tax=Sphingomonas citricola TaxID=2862498 RepID=UPI001CA47975|nr:hypothetical protein [Sphingomonas citricola]MBW6522532.1 hypothetical protein [Sphingomonas citricola]